LFNNKIEIMKNRFTINVLLIAAILLGLSAAANAQTYDEWKKQRDQEMQQFKQDREKQIQALADEFDKYVEERDKEFADYLKTRWTEFQVFQGVEVPEEPKPDVAPVFTKPDRPKPPEALPTIIPEIRIKPDEVSRPILPRVTRQEPPKFPVHSKDFDFYGYPVIFDFDKKMKAELPGGVSKESISNYFETLSSTNYNHLIGQLVDYKNQMNLNDWGYYLMVKKASEVMAGPDARASELLKWFILLRSGYKVKIAYFEDEVFLLIPIVNQVYGKNFFQLDNMNYYLMDGELTQLYTYETDFPDAQKAFDLNIYRALSLGDDLSEKTFNFNYEKAEAPISVIYNANVIDFYKDYPQGDIKVYFDAVVSSVAGESLALNFLPLIQGKSELEAVNLLLNFVQTGFAYQTDQEQFGYEKFFFSEEVFYYPYCDCEDRSVLFAYLVKSLLGLEVVGLKYEGHIATAVKFNGSVNGDFISYNGDRYVVSDPTYIMAPVGLTMPRYANEAATIVAISNNYNTRLNEEKIWQEVIAAGGNRGSNSGDIIISTDGSAVLAGYFTGNFSYSNIDLSGNGSPSMFAMKLDADKNPSWFSSAEVDGAAIAYSVVPGKNGNIYIAGTFRGEMELMGAKLETGELSDVFVAKLDSKGELGWLQKANIDTVNQENYLNFVSSFSSDGRHTGNEFYFETGDFNNYGLHLGTGDEVYFAGAFNKTTGMNVSEMSYAEFENFSLISAIKKENDRLVAEKYEKTIAGLFAVLNLIKSSGTTIPGSDVQEVLDKYNPDFKVQAKDMYKAIGELVFLKNLEGIITIKTKDGKDVKFDKLLVKNNTKGKVIHYENGDAQLEVLSGAKVEKGFLSFILNHVLMYKQNGDMLFDFSESHFQRTYNLKEDILFLKD
jgi:hypothetical protein